MKFYMRLSDGRFPCYLRSGDPKNYVEVRATEEDDFDPATQRLGNWTQPEKQGSEYVAYRRAVDKSQKEIEDDEQSAWQNIRSERDAALASSDIELLRALEVVINDPKISSIKAYRQSLRDITDPGKNGGERNPHKIDLKALVKGKP